MSRPRRASRNLLASIASFAAVVLAAVISLITIDLIAIVFVFSVVVTVKDASF